MSSEQLRETLIGCFDCKQGAVRAVRFNGECVHCSTVTVYYFDTPLLRKVIV